MLKIISLRIASTGLIVLFSLIIIFHGMAILGVVPYEMLWGGRLKNTEEMLVFELVSVGLNLLMLGIVAIHSEVWTVRVSKRVTTIALWIMSILFLLNTIGNILSRNELERMIFTPLTVILFIFCIRLALSSSNPTEKEAPR